MLRLRHIAGALCSALLLGTCAAQTKAPEPPPAPPLVSPERQGYAFEFPRVLAEQRLLGVAHGISLLASACLDVPEHADAAADAYTQWYEQQHHLVDEIKNELAVFYYGPHAAEATWDHLVAVLKLRKKLGLAPESEQLKAACATLPEALKQPRYDLNSLFQLETALAGMAMATRAESYTAACGAKQTEAKRTALNATYAEWQAREAEAVVTARQQLQTYWENTATPGTADEWLDALKKGYAKPTTTQCQNLSDWLASNQSMLAQSFAPAPGVKATAAVPAAEVSTAAATNPESAPAPAAKSTDPEPEEQELYLFDYLMKLFDERPYEAQPNGKPTRSQRAHP